MVDFYFFVLAYMGCNYLVVLRVTCLLDKFVRQWGYPFL